jgi:uncharacterized flavoprotein (TIGR03862 family)
MTPTIAIIGSGPAGLMAAEVLSQHGLAVAVYDAMRSVGRKFLIAGRGGLNLTHSEPYPQFIARYGPRQPQLEPMLAAFGPEDVQRWVHNLGFETFVGSSGRIFSTDMKAAPLLRAWLQRLRQSGVRFHLRHNWLGWADEGALRFATPDGEKLVQADAVILALGGGSWAKLGSTGAWVPLLVERGVDVAALRPSNCGFDVGWTEHFRSRFAGHPLKAVSLTFTNAQGETWQQQGEFVITATGVEGSLIYAVSAAVRDEIEVRGTAVIHLDLSPHRSQQYLTDRLSQPRGSRSLANHLKSRVRLQGVKAGLLHEFLPAATFANPTLLAQAIKSLPIPLVAPRPLDEAISSAGGVRFEALDENGMILALPGVFCAGEMLDWEAPTGGYLLTACLANGRAAALGVLAWLKANNTYNDTGATHLPWCEAE